MLVHGDGEGPGRQPLERLVLPEQALMRRFRATGPAARAPGGAAAASQLALDPGFDLGNSGQVSRAMTAGPRGVPRSAGLPAQSTETIPECLSPKGAAASVLRLWGHRAASLPSWGEAEERGRRALRRGRGVAVGAHGPLSGVLMGVDGDARLVPQLRHGAALRDALPHPIGVGLHPLQGPGAVRPPGVGLDELRRRSAAPQRPAAVAHLLLHPGVH